VEFIKEISNIRCLVKQETVCGALEFDTKIFLHRVQVNHTKLCHQLRRVELLFVCHYKEMMIIFVV
jgi:hypothetical protein